MSTLPEFRNEPLTDFSKTENKAAMELALSNYVSNAVKYRCPDEPHPWVRVEAELREPEGCEVVVSEGGVEVPSD